MNGARSHGFSLLEVMIALALLAMSFTGLILVQGRMTGLAVQARNITTATQLARLQLMECKRKAQRKIASTGDFKLEGDYTDIGFPDYKWECHAPKFNMRTPSASAVEKGFRETAPDAAKKNMAGSASTVSAPFIGMITDALADSVRELVVIVRWTDNAVDDEVRVVTHIVDLNAMSGLARVLNEGAKSFESKDEKKKEKNPGKGGAPKPGENRPGKVEP